jgi:dolichol-phosphate mannosyltransferase
MKKRPPELLHIIVPVYNEAANFPGLYKALAKHVKTPFKLVVVYDFDEDTTVPVAKKYAAKDKRVILYKNTLGRGALNALKSGLTYAKKGPVLTMMADLCDDAKDVDAIYAQYLAGYDLVCGSRYMEGGQQIGSPFIKRNLSHLAGVSLYWLRRLPIHDATNNFRLYDRALLKKIPIESGGGFEVAMELTVKAHKLGYSMTEVPTTWRDRVAGEANFKLWKWLPSYLRWYLLALF